MSDPVWYHTEKTLFVALTAFVLLGTACSGDRSEAPRLQQGATPGAAVGTGGTTGSAEKPNELPSVDLSQTGSAGASPATPVKSLPSGFTAAAGAKDGSDKTTLRGGYRLVGPLTAAVDPSAGSCANVLRVLIRDFVTYDHPDFGGGKSPENAAGLVLEDLIDRKPVRSQVFPNVAVQFEDWYANVDGTNAPFLLDLWLEPNGDTFVFDSSRFFPLDSVAPSEARHNDDDQVRRNFGFTTELHSQFVYRGGEVFTFRGDDDVFVFIDRKRVVDLGGVHFPTSGSVNIDTLGLRVGEVYNLDLFQAERNPTGSNFRIETSLAFTNCGEILPTDVIR